MESNNSTLSGGIGILGVLGIVFVTLKLIGVINWSWWWVTLPFWGGFALIIAISILFGVLAGLIYYFLIRNNEL